MRISSPTFSRITAWLTRGTQLGVAVTFILAGAADVARAVGAVGFNAWDVAQPTVQVLAGGSALASSKAGLASSMAGNPALNGSAWAHTGRWWNLELGTSPSVTIRVQAQDASALAPGLSVWSSGAATFDGGTTGFGGELSSAGFGTPHSFNAFGPLGDPGTLWMQSGAGGNMQELLGYAIAGPSFLGTTGWGETIATGAHDLSLTNAFVTAVSGSVGAGYAELILTGVQAGWYTIYVGGTQHGLAGGLYDLSVSSVPEPTTALLLGLGLAGISVARRGRGSAA